MSGFWHNNVFSPPFFSSISTVVMEFNATYLTETFNDSAHSLVPTVTQVQKIHVPTSTMVALSILLFLYSFLIGACCKLCFIYAMKRYRGNYRQSSVHFNRVHDVIYI